MKIIAFTKKNPNYRIRGHPEEDSFKYHKNKNKIIIAVADGETRDLVDGKYLKLSPAKKAADLFCKSFVTYLEKLKPNKAFIRKAFRYSNDLIRKLNKKNNPNPNYLENDFWACVAVGGVIENSQLCYGFIADCGVAIFDKNGKLRFRTPDEGANKDDSIDKDVARRYKTSFGEDKGRRIIRSEYRNNPSNPISCGSLTGEKSAMSYVRTGSIKINDGDYIVFYSDGFARILYSNDFDISRKFNGSEKYVSQHLDKIDGGEGTLVALLFQK